MKFLAFDLDGVLVNSKGLHDYAFVQALLHCGMREAADAYRDAPMEEVSTRDKLVRLNVAHKYDEVKVAKDKVFLELVPKIEFSPFLALDLERATRHAPVIVVTNCTAWMAREICRHAGIGHVPLIAPEIGQPTKPDTCRVNARTRSRRAQSRRLSLTIAAPSENTGVVMMYDTRSRRRKPSRESTGRSSTSSQYIA